MARERGIKTSELAIAGTIVPEQMAFWNSIDEAAAAGVLDWDLILRLGNSRFDRIVETIQEPAQARRRAAQARLDLEIRKQNDESRDKLKLGIRMFFNRRDAVSESIGHSLYALFTTGLRLAAYSQDDSLVRLDLTRLGFALAAIARTTGPIRRSWPTWRRSTWPRYRTTASAMATFITPCKTAVIFSTASAPTARTMAEDK